MNLIHGHTFLQPSTGNTAKNLMDLVDLATCVVGSIVSADLADGCVTSSKLGTSIGLGQLDLIHIPIDSFAPGSDIVTDNASAAHHGLLPKLSNVANQYLSGLGTWTVPMSLQFVATVNETASYPVVAADAGKYFTVDTTAGAATMTLPAASAVPDGTILAFQKVSADANAMIIQVVGADHIDNQTTLTVATQWLVILIKSDGVATWNVTAVSVGGINAANPNSGAVVGTNALLIPSNALVIPVNSVQPILEIDISVINLSVDTGTVVMQLGFGSPSVIDTASHYYYHADNEGHDDGSNNSTSIELNGPRCYNIFSRMRIINSAAANKDGGGWIALNDREGGTDVEGGNNWIGGCRNATGVITSIQLSVTGGAITMGAGTQVNVRNF